MIGTTLQNRYRLDAQLGRGGMGVVYRGHDILLNRGVAVKMLSERASLDTEGRARLLREAQSVAQLNHPNVVSVYDAGEANGSPFIVTELVGGESLHERRPQDLDETLAIMCQVCTALEHAHANGIIHRDLKPENVLLAPDGTAKLMDFGLARSVASRLTTEGTIIGTVFYLSPEQALGQTIDNRADLYSLGVMLYELTTGQLPFTADDVLGVISQHLHAPVVPPRAKNPEIPLALDSLIVQLLSKAPEDRPASAARVLDALTEALSLQPPGASLPTRVPSEPSQLTGGIALLDRMVRGRLLGRESELAELRNVWDRAARGEGHLVLISGEPGIGKTRLAQELTVYAQLRGALILEGHFDPESGVPYLGFWEALRNHVRSRPPELARKEIGSAAPELIKLVPEVEEIMGTVKPNPPMGEAEAERLRLFDHITQFLLRLAAQSPILFLLDDLHWADEPSLQLLHFILRNTQQAPVLLVGTYCETELEPARPLYEALVGLNRERLYTRLILSRLPADDVGELLRALLDSPVDDRLVNAIARETDGNPFFVEEVVKSLLEQNALQIEAGRYVPVEGSELEVPQSIQIAIGKRLAGLSGECQLALRQAAVLGHKLDFEVLLDLGEWEEDPLLDALDEAEQAQLIAQVKGRGETGYRFEHELLVQVLYNSINRRRQARLHQRAGEALERIYANRLDEHVEALARHFSLARPDVAEKALTYSLQAAEKAMAVYAYRQTARQYERALALTDQPVVQMDAYLGLGRAFILLDDHKAATAVIRQGLHLAERCGDDARRARLLYAQAQNASRQHRSDGGKPEVEAALVAAEQAGDEVYLAQSLLLLAEVHESSGDLCSALETATRAQIVCSKLNDNQLEARALLEIGFLRAQRAEFNEAASAAELGLKLLAETDDRNAIAYAWNILGRALGGRGDYGHALDAFHRSQEEAQVVGDRYLLAQVFNMQGWLHRELGDYEYGLSLDEKGVDFAKRWGKPSPEISARLNVCLDVLHLGDPERALVLLDEIEVQINAGSFGFHSWRWRLRLLHARGLCFLALDEPAKALASVEGGLPLAETKVARKYVALNHELRGMALADLGNMDGAIGELETAISLADAIQYQPTRWAGRHQLARLYHQNGREQEARSTLSEAEHIIQTIATSLEDEDLRVTFLNAALPE